MTQNDGIQYKVVNFAKPLTPMQLKQILYMVSDNPKRDGIHERHMECEINWQLPLHEQVFGGNGHKGLFRNLGNRHRDPHALFVLPRLAEVGVLIVNHLLTVRSHPVQIVRFAKDTTSRLNTYKVSEILELKANHNALV